MPSIAADNPSITPDPRARIILPSLKDNPINLKLDYDVWPKGALGYAIEYTVKQGTTTIESGFMKAIPIIVDNLDIGVDYTVILRVFPTNAAGYSYTPTLPESRQEIVLRA